MNMDNNVEQQSQSRVFNPSEHMMQIKSGQTSKDYLPVQWRLVWFRTAFPHGTIETEMLHLDMDRDTEEDGYAWNAERRRSEKIVKQAKGFCVFRAVVKDGVGGVAVGTKSEKAASFGDFIEKAETGAIGRALAALGYGTQFTGDEFEEQHRIVDSPVERNTATTPTTATTTPAATGNTTETPTNATEQQLSSIRKLHDHLGKRQPDTANLSYVAARKMIQQLTAEYRESKQGNKAS